MKDTNTIKWGIIGLGNIANQFASDLLLIENAVITAAASRDSNKAAEFAQKYKVQKSYDSYDALLKDDQVDIVYIATPHDSHAELSIKALENGKHVLCEKPIALSFSDAEKMVEASRKHNKFFMEAFWTRFIPAVQEVLYKINNGIIGDLKYINADFTFLAKELEGNRMTDKKLGGGALFDVGVYPLFLSYVLLGKPNEITAKSTYHKTGVDLQTTMILQYENAQAVLHAGFVSESNMKALISGTEGRIEINSPWYVADGYSIFKDNHEAGFNLPVFGKGYAHEALECHYCIQNNMIESKQWSHQNSLDLSSIVEEIKNQIGLEF